MRRSGYRKGELLILFLHFVQLCSIYFSIDWDKSLIVGMSWCTAMDSIGVCRLDVLDEACHVI